jgi:hypothetical protein
VRTPHNRPVGDAIAAEAIDFCDFRFIQRHDDNSKFSQPLKKCCDYRVCAPPNLNDMVEEAVEDLLKKYREKKKAER